MTSSLRIRRLHTPRSTARTVLTGFLHGLAQMGSAATVGTLSGYPKSRSEDAFRSDWNHVGNDMERGIEKARSREEAKA
jgi:hypothetical protein